MTTYLGAFPFPSLAPCIVTREAMLKVVTLLTGRYIKVLKRGEQDQIKLLFKSLAVFDRRNSSALSPSTEKKSPESTSAIETASTGFSIDQPLNDEEEEDDDDLVLAALDALDAIEVFKEDLKQDRKVHHAHIPVYNLERLLMLLLLIAPLGPQDDIAQICGAVTESDVEELEQSARSLIAAFDPQDGNINYSNFIRTMTTLSPKLFRPLSPLFEHFLFSKQLDLTKHNNQIQSREENLRSSRSPLLSNESRSSWILNDILLAQLSTSIEISSTASSTASSFFHTNAQMNQLYSTASDGTSLSSFSRQVTSWRSASLLLLRGTPQDSETMSSQPYILGAYLPDYWKEDSSTSTNSTSTTLDDPKPLLFQLSPRHAIFRGNPSTSSSTNTTQTHLNTRTGISLGAIIPPSSRLTTSQAPPIPGPVSLLIDTDLSTAIFQHDGSAGTGAYLTDPLLEEQQQQSPSTTQPKKLSLDIDALEVWGISFASNNDDQDDEITKQKKRLAWEEAEAERRRGVNFGGDKDGARRLLEMAGIVGDGGRSGGSV